MSTTEINGNHRPAPNPRSVSEPYELQSPKMRSAVQSQSDFVEETPSTYSAGTSSGHQRSVANDPLGGSDSDTSSSSALQANQERFAALEVMRTAEKLAAATYDDGATIGDLVAYQIAADNAQQRLSDIMNNEPETVRVITVEPDLSFGTPVRSGIDPDTGQYLGATPGTFPSVGQIVSNIVFGRSQRPDERLEDLSEEEIYDLEVSQQQAASVTANAVVFGLGSRVDDLAAQYAPGPLKPVVALGGKVLLGRVVNPIAQEASDVISDHVGQPNVVPGPGMLTWQNVGDVVPSATSIIAGEAAKGVAKTALLTTAAYTGIAVPEPISTIVGLGTAIMVGSEVFVLTDNIMPDVLPKHDFSESSEPVDPPTLDEYLDMVSKATPEVLVSEDQTQPNDGHPVIAVDVVDSLAPLLLEHPVYSPEPESIEEVEVVPVFRTVRTVSFDDGDNDDGFRLNPFSSCEPPEWLEKYQWFLDEYSVSDPRCFADWTEEEFIAFMREERLAELSETIESLSELYTELATEIDIPSTDVVARLMQAGDLIEYGNAICFVPDEEGEDEVSPHAVLG